MVSRLSCAPAIPSLEELNNYLSRRADVPRPDLDEEINYLHRVTTRTPEAWNELCVFAFDHRKQLYQMAVEADADPQRIPYLKDLLLKAAQSAASKPEFIYQPGVLVDDTYGQNALNNITGKGWWIGRPVELPSSRPLTLEGKASIGSRLASWPAEHIVKCLVFYHPQDEPELRLEQEKTISALYHSCCTSGHELLLEVIPPADMPADEQNVVRVLERLYNLGIRPDWWKLPVLSKSGWKQVSTLINARSPHCRGVIILGLDAPLQELEAAFNDSANFPLCKGFAVGRSIFSDPSRAWFKNEINDDELIQQVQNNYLQLVNSWHNRKSEEVA